MNHQSGNHPPPSYWRSRALLAFCVLTAVAAFFLWSEHRAHLMGALPYLLLLACPLMHVFMHGGHGGHAPQQSDMADRSTTRSGKAPD